MLQRWSDGVSPKAFSVLLCYLFLILPLQSQTCEAVHEAQSKLISPHRPVVALAGHYVILPCHLEPSISVISETVTWIRHDLIPKYVHVHRDGQTDCERQNPSYHERTALFENQLRNGDVSLNIDLVKPSDAGTYFCILPSMDKKSFIHLIVDVHEVKSVLICSNEPIVALAGDDVILPCHLEPPISVISETVVWTKYGLVPKYIYVHYEGKLMSVRQNPSYNNRTTLSDDELMNGEVCLKISKVKISDAGRYDCSIVSMQKDSFIQLIVGAVSMPTVDVVSNNNGSVALHCESEGWYPEPEVLWLDGEGNLLSAGPAETVRGPDDLYTVSSRVTVEKRHSNRFTCRVQQKDINQTREAHIHVPADLFRVQSSSHWLIISFTVLAAFLLIIIIIIIWKMKCPKRTEAGELEKLNQPARLSDDTTRNSRKVRYTKEDDACVF